MNTQNSAYKPAGTVYIDSQIRTDFKLAPSIADLRIHWINIEDNRIPGGNTQTPVISCNAEFLTSAEASGLLALHILDSTSLRHLETIPPDRLLFHSLQSALEWVGSHPSGIPDMEKQIQHGAEALKNGDLTAFPTETVYGLGANALDPLAVEKIFTAKKRPKYDPLILHISEMSQLEPLVSSIPGKALELAEKFWPGPLTMVFPKSSLVPDICTSGHPTVAVRMPSNPWAQKLIHLAGLPIAAPSANLFGRTSPTTAAHVAEQLEGSYEVLIDAGACRVGVESTVLSLTGSNPQLLRTGGVSREAMEALIGPVELPQPKSAGDSESPGMLPNHYAPRTPLMMVPDVRDYTENSDIGVILYEEYTEVFQGPVRSISHNRNPREIAVGIYAALRELDNEDISLIIAEWCPEEDIGAAVNDRLRKASAPAVISTD